MAIYHESRGESILGQSSVGYSIINRSKDKEYPKNVCEIIHQKSQYGFITKKLKIKNKEEFEKSKRIARLVLEGKLNNPIGNRKFFNTYQMFKTNNKPKRIGKHVFF